MQVFWHFFRVLKAEVNLTAIQVHCFVAGKPVNCEEHHTGRPIADNSVNCELHRNIAVCGLCPPPAKAAC